MTTQEDEKLEYKPPPPTRTDLGYTWDERDIHDIMESLGSYFARQKAKVFIQDVYASNGHVYRNILIQLPKLNEAWEAENIYIQFDKDEGRQLSINRS